MGRIFISYHGRDEGQLIALHLHDALIAGGYEDVHAYTALGSGPEVSLPWRDSLRSHLLSSDAIVVITTPGASSEWCLWELSVFREAKPDAPCIELVSGVRRGHAVLDDLQAQLVDPSSPESLAAAKDTVLRILDRHGVGKAGMTDSPYPGLKAFDEHQSPLFFGREDDIKRLAAPLLGSRTNGAMAVIGPSGAGKSSLVRAGLIPLLRRKGWTITGPATPAQDALDIITATGCSENHVIVLDQAEELLIGAQDGTLAPEPSALVKALIEVSRASAWVVFTVRADFLDALMQHEEFAPLLRDNFLVNQLTTADLPVVVNGPLRARGWRVDEAALGSILEDTSRDSLPLLAFALESLWWHVNPDGTQPPRAITRAEYLASGRVMDVLRRQAEDAFAMARDLVRHDDGSWPHPRDAELRVLRTLHRLAAVDASGRLIRRPLALRELAPSERRLLDPFITNRVLTTVRLGSTTSDGWERHGRDAVEVAHESLFAYWPRLRESLERDQAALFARHEVEDIAAAWVRHPDQLIAPSRLTSLLTVLWPAVGDESFAGSWKQLDEAMTALDLSETARQLLALSVQHTLDDTVQRARLLDPNDALRSLADDDIAVRMLWLAPDLTGWRRALLEALSSTPLLRSIPGRAAGLRGVDWSPDDTLLVTGSNDGDVRVQDADSGDTRQVFSHGTDVTAVAWSPAGDVIASVSGDVTLRLWSVREEREVRSLRLTATPLSVRFDAEGTLVLVACADGAVHLWDVLSSDQEPIWKFRPPNDGIRQVRLWDADLSADGRWIAMARDDNRIILTNTGDTRGSTGPTYINTTTAARTVRFHPLDNEILASGYVDGTVRLQKAGRDLHLIGHTDLIHRVAWSPDGTRLATASADGAVRVWDAVTGREVLQLPGHRQAVRDIAWSNRGDRLATVSDDGVQRTWKIGSEPDYRWFSTREPVRALAWNPVEADLLVGVAERPDDDGSTSRWTLEVSRRDITYAPHPSPGALAWTQQGDRLAVGTPHGDVLLYDEHLHFLVRLTTDEEAADSAADVHWSADGSLLAVASRDYKGLPRIYDRHGTRVLPPEWTRHPGRLKAVSWHPYRMLVALAGEENLITVNSMDRTLCDFRSNKRFLSLAWHPGGELLAAGCADATVLVLHMTEVLSEVIELRGHRDEINVVAWSPDGESLLTASEDGTARLWHPLTGGLRTTLIGHSSAVTAALWLPDGVVVTGSADRTVRFWDVSDSHTHPPGIVQGDDVADLVAEARRRFS